MDKKCRDSYGQIDYLDDYGNIIKTGFEDPELDEAMKNLSDSIDKTYEKSNFYEFIKKRYRTNYKECDNETNKS
ncbi:putative S-adenosyl-l-methionine hydroxide adenosyltransferase [Campylobacter phage F372]|uniref:Putative S-adenosyl-l-methionine hydroxide adenosyltransferase n=1 Tax=Campylobacter phage F372 TaxID=2794375 RepID=A0A7T3N5D0_9CAUD|nr:putative S-adenosyl-l-methionine hydroxide adenosyltransferase [Campylobacter phage F372]